LLSDSIKAAIFEQLKPKDIERRLAMARCKAEAIHILRQTVGYQGFGLPNGLRVSCCGSRGIEVIISGKGEAIIKWSEFLEYLMPPKKSNQMELIA